jgi:tryptophan synthase alpha chain
MQNRIDRCFEQLRTRGEKGFIAYVCAGDPSLSATVEIALTLEKAGTDLIELGVPFSDPLADGIVNQMASQRALEAGASVRGVLACVRAIRRTSEVPLVLYTYLNPIFQFGFDRFHEEAEAAGVDGLLILDLPPDEERDRTNKYLKHIRLVAPTTPVERIAKIAASADGFIYYVSREGVTGEQSAVEFSLGEKVERVRAVSDLPIAIGFGVSNPEQVREVARHGDAVVVGSAIVKRIAEQSGQPDFLAALAEFVTPLAAATR